MKVNELIYVILDNLKITSDDSYITEGHVLFLCKKYRSFLIKKEQEKERSTGDIASEFETQQICLDLEKVPAIDGDPCTGGYYLKSIQQIPKLLEGNQPRVYPVDYYQGTNISYVSRDKMRYVGTNPYLQNIIYVSLGPDFKLTLKSNNPQFFYLKKLRLSGVFEDFDKAADLLCDDAGSPASCDPLDMEFPIRDYLVPMLIELVTKEIGGSKYSAADKVNDANDNLSGMSSK